MFTKILIANRGEIACRIIKSAKQLGILTVAVYSDADIDALHVQMADEAVHIGESPSKASYLIADKIIAAAKRTQAQAIHPGYGFLSENAEFCRQCHQESIIFIGPPASAIEAMGSKSAAKIIMEQAKVPLVPGYHDEDQSIDILRQAADDIGYPVLLKATAGGGGKGMRQVWHAKDFKKELAAAQREAKASFNDDTMLVEKYLTQPRHVEIQVFCDHHGNGVYLFERDCSVQRRHQKVIEEAPAFNISEELRQQMGESALKSAQAINYQGAGTVEFLLDSDGAFYFMEMNTRLQVEHPVTEMITGQDLVAWQLQIAAGEPLPKTQKELTITGHAFEARIYAEDPNNQFLPATGEISFLHTPIESKHVRIDTGIRQGDQVSVFYDPMISKLIVWDEDRNKALQRLTKALAEYQINGVCTNIDFLYNVATCQAFIDTDIDTGFIEKNHQQIFHENSQALADELPMAALYLILAQAKQSQQAAEKSQDPYSPWHLTNAWRLNDSAQHTFTLSHNHIDYPIKVEQQQQGDKSHYLIEANGQSVLCHGEINGNRLQATIAGHRKQSNISHVNDEISLYQQNGVFTFYQKQVDYDENNDDSLQGGLVAPMNGTIVSTLVKINERVEKDQPLIIMEAMKMEHTIKAPSTGTIEEIFFNEGDMVDGGVALVAFTNED